jgi:hypothetical protein
VSGSTPGRFRTLRGRTRSLRHRPNNMRARAVVWLVLEEVGIIGLEHCHLWLILETQLEIPIRGPIQLRHSILAALTVLASSHRSPVDEEGSRAGAVHRVPMERTGRIVVAAHDTACEACRDHECCRRVTSQSPFAGRAAEDPPVQSDATQKPDAQRLTIRRRAALLAHVLGCHLGGIK